MVKGIPLTSKQVNLLSWKVNLICPYGFPSENLKKMADLTKKVNLLSWLLLPVHVWQKKIFFETKNASHFLSGLHFLFTFFVRSAFGFSGIPSLFLYPSLFCPLKKKKAQKSNIYINFCQEKEGIQEQY